MPGYWYSEVYRDVPLPNNTPLGAAFQCYSCQLENFHIDSDAMSRAEVDGGGGAEDTTGNNWLIEGMWVQHVESSLWASGSGGTAENNLFTVIFADGCNLNNVSLTGTSGSNLTATNNFIRGTGDDGMAINSVAYNGSQTYTAMSDITMSHNTVIAPWGGKGIGVYGGSGHLVEDNFISDTARYIGLGVGRFGVNGSDMLGATVTGNVIVRSGGNAYFQGQPALQIGNGGDGQNVGTVTDATVTGNTIINSVYDSIGFSTSTSTNLADNTITSPWRNGIVISPPYYPAPTGNATITGNSVTGVGSGFSAYSNDSSGFTATLSNNSWQGGSSEGPYGGTPAAVPGVVQAENYDTGGQGVAYNVTSTNGTGNSYRSDGIDLETTSDTRRRLRPGLDVRRAVVPLHRQRGLGRDLHRQLPRRGPLGRHRRPAPGQRVRREPERERQHPRDRRLAELDHGHRHRPAGGRPADPRRRRGQRRLEPQLPVLRRQRRHQPEH